LFGLLLLHTNLEEDLLRLPKISKRMLCIGGRPVLVKKYNISFLCNPLRRTSVKLPSISSTKICLAGIVAGEGESPDTYKVVVVGKSSPVLRVHT